MYVLALDQGTTSSRAIVFDRCGQTCSVAHRETLQLFPRPGWVEQDAMRIWNDLCDAVLEALQRGKVKRNQIAAVGISNQRESTVIWDRLTGLPIAPAIIWQDRRTAKECESLRRPGVVDLIRSRTGLLMDPYFCATKIAWLLENVNGSRKLAEEGRLAFGTIDSWLAFKLTCGRIHVTDITNASRTLLYDIFTGEWDDELLKLFGIPHALLPEVRESSTVYGEITGLPALLGVTLSGIAGDQQAALLGQLCTEPGSVKTTYGTGCFSLLNIGSVAKVSRTGLLTTLAPQVGSGVTYALEGSVFAGGAVVRWLRDGLRLIHDLDEVESLSKSVNDSGGIFLVPAFTGLGVPYWDPYARGIIVGLTLGTTAGHIARAALEGIAYQVADLLDALVSESSEKPTEVRVDGGASRNNLLMQFQSDITGLPVVRPVVTESTSLGAAYLAGLAVGFWSGIEELSENWQIERCFEPAMPMEQAFELRGTWARAVNRAKGWAKE